MTDPTLRMRPEDVKGAHREFFQTGAHNELLAKLKVRRDRTEMSEEDALSSIRKLDHVTKNRRAARKIARNKDTIQTLLGSIQSRPRFGKLVEFSVECLKNLAVDEVSIEEMIDEGALEVLMKVARLNPYNEKIAKAVNLCIKSFAINDYLAKKIIDHVGAGTFNFSLKKHVKPDTLESTCNAMVAVMKSVEGIDELVADGCVPCIKHVIDGNAEQIEVVTAATSVAATIASVPEYAGQLVESGLAESVLVALRHNSDDPQLARIGADFVGRLAASKDEAVLERLKALEAVDVLVAALEANPHDAALLEIGAAALGVLTDESSMGTALEAVQVGDQSKPADMGMIASLCLVDSNIDYVIAHEGVGVIIAAVIKAKEMPDSPETRRAMEAGCRALMRLAGDETKIYKIMQERGVKAIVSVLSSHIDDEDIASAAIGALGRMMTREENATYIIRCKGLKAMVAALRTNPESATVAQYSIDMMASMAQFPSAVAKLMEYSCASDIIHAILTHSEEAAIVTAGIIGLSRLASLPENIPGIVKAGGVHAIMEVLNTHATEDEETALATLQLLATVASLPEAAAQLRDAGCMDSVLRVMEAHPDNAEIQEAGANALGLVVGGEEVKQSVGKVASLVAKLEALAAGASGDHVFKPLDPALKMLANLAAVSKNIKFFTSNGASDTLHSAFVLASECAPTQLRDSIMLSAMQGIARLAQHSSESEKMRLVTSGTLASLCAFVAAHPESGELYPEVLARLAHVLATASPEIAAAMMNDPTLLQNLMSIARAHPLNETVQAGIANFLCAMAQDEAAALGIIREGGAAVVVEAIYGNMSDKLALVSCLNALPALAVSEEAVRALMDAGAVAAILDVMRNHPGEAEIIMRCVKALGSMLVVVDVAEQIGTKGGLPLLLRALRDHYAVEQLVEMNLLLLDSLALVRANADILLEKKHGTIALVEWAASTFKRNDTIQDAALRLLDTLLGIRDGLIDDPLAPLGAATLESLSPDDLNMMLQTLSDGAEPETVLSVLGTIAKVALDDEQASLIRSSNGFEILRSVLLENTEQEGVFRAATVAFQNLTGDLNEHPEVLELLQNPGMVQAVIEMLKPHSNFVSDADPAELVQALEILGQLASREANVASILANGGLDPLLRFLTSGNPDVMAAAAKALANLSNSDAAALELSRLIDIRALIQAMRNNFEMIEFLTYAVYLLARLAVNDDMKNRIGIEGGLQVIIQCMTTYSDNARLVENCCYALGELSCECDVNISFIMACKGVEALLQAMDVFPHKPALLDSAICALCNLCFNNDANKRRIVELGGCRHLVLAILDNVDSDELVMSAFRTLGNLSFLPTNIPTVIREGGVQAIVASMTYHHEHFDLIDMAMRVLGALAADVDAENMAIMAQEGAVQAIVDVAAQHTKNLDLQVTAVDSLCEFAREPTNARMIVRQGGLQSMVATMDVLHFDPELAENCLRLFALLSWNEANLDTMLDPINRVVTTVLDGLRAHLAGPPMLLGSGLQCLTRLAYNADSALTVARLGAVQCILSVAQQNLSQKDVLKYSFQSLGVLCRDETNAAAMAEQAMKFLVIALQTHGNDPQFANASFSFLSDLCVFPDAAQATLKVDIIQATLDVLNSCLDDHVLTVRRGLRALENMALSSDEVKVRLEDVGAVPRLERLRSRFEAREDVVGAVNRVLHAISMRSNRRTSGKHKPRSVKALFQAPKVDDLSEEVRNLLTAGQLFIKHSKTAKPRKRHVYVTADLKRLCWKEPHRPLKEKQQIPVYLLRTVEKGRATEQLQRKRKFGGYFVKHEEHAFAVLGRERTLDLEAANVAERNQWVDALTALIKWREDLKRANSQF